MIPQTFANRAPTKKITNSNIKIKIEIVLEKIPQKPAILTLNWRSDFEKYSPRGQDQFWFVNLASLFDLPGSSRRKSTRTNPGTRTGVLFPYRSEVAKTLNPGRSTTRRNGENIWSTLYESKEKSCKILQSLAKYCKGLETFSSFLLSKM